MISSGDCEEPDIIFVENSSHAETYGEHRNVLLLIANVRGGVDLGEGLDKPELPAMVLARCMSWPSIDRSLPLSEDSLLRRV
jgi:hypothetical protein